MSPLSAARRISSQLRNEAVAEYARWRVAHETRRLLARNRLVVSDFEVVYHTSLHPYDAALKRRGKGYVLEISKLDFDDVWHLAGDRTATYLAPMIAAGKAVDRITFTLSDGHFPSAARFAPSAFLPGVVPIPDPYFFNTSGFAGVRRATDAHSPAWNERTTEFTWRGITTGDGLWDPRAWESEPDALAPRLRLCLKLQGVPGTDVGLVASTHRELAFAALVGAGVARGYIEELSWLGRKFAIDIDGNSNTWSNLITRMHMGCCVLKVQSRHGFRQWYYDRLKPWEHYVPVRADLSDIAEKVEWVRSNDAEAEQIGKRGQALARSLDWASVEAEAVALITDNWQAPYPAS